MFENQNANVPIHEINISEYIFCFSLDKLKIGLFLKDVFKVIRAIEVSPLPGAPPIIKGVININGKIIPVVNFRKRLKLKEKAISTNQVIIIAHSESYEFCFLADEIEGLKPYNNLNYSTSGTKLHKSDEIIQGIAIVENEIILVHDINTFLTPKEEEQTTAAIEKNELNQ